MTKKKGGPPAKRSPPSVLPFPAGTPRPSYRPKKKGDRDLLKSVLVEARRAFDQDTPAMREERRRRIQNGFDGFGFFCATYLPHYFPRPPASFHKEMVELALSEPRLALAAPRGHAKSTIMTFALPIWLLVTGQSMFCVIVGASAPEARAFVGAIREELEQNQKIIGDFGDLRGGPPWNSRVLRLSTGQRLRALGRGERFRGMKARQHRPDRIICDDMEDDDEVESPDQRKKVRAWFFKALVNTLDPQGRIFVVGTILHDDSLLAELLRNEEFVSRLWKAIQDDGTALWPAVWPIEALEAKRRLIGSLEFEQEFQNNAAREQIFQKEWIRYYDPREIKGKHLSVYMVVDPAIGLKKKNDWFAIVVIGIDKDGTIYVLAVYEAKLKVSAQVDKIFEHYLEYRPLVVGVESIAYQQALKQLVDEKSKKDRLYIPTKELKPDTDKERRIMVLSPLVERGDIWFHPCQKAWVESEVLLFPRAQHDDGLDGLEQAVGVARRGSRSFKHQGARRRQFSERMWPGFLGSDQVKRSEIYKGY